MSAHPTYEYKSDASLVRWLSRLFKLYIVAAAGLLLSEILVITVYPTLFDENAVAGGVELAVLFFAGLAGVGIVGTYLGLIVLFCIWHRGANRNAHALGAAAMQFTPGWCVGYWFIPFANLIRPYQTIGEIYRASAIDDGTWAFKPVPTWIGIWWFAWLGTNILGNVELRMSLAEDPARAAIANTIAPFSSVLGILSAILAIRVVTSIHRLQSAKSDAKAME